MKDFSKGDFYDTEDLEKMSKDDLVFVTECLQRQLSEAQRILSQVLSNVLVYEEVKSTKEILEYRKKNSMEDG
jgi:hypothetical protein